MGFKRPFDDECQDLPFKQARQVNYSNGLTQFCDSGAHRNVPQKTYMAGTDDYEGRFDKLQWHEDFENDTSNEVPNLSKDSDSSAPLSLVTSSSSDEDFGSGPAAYASHSPECFEFEFPQKTSMHLEDVNSSYLDDFPRKPVPLGPNHQASIPPWGRHIKKDESFVLFETNASSPRSELDHNMDGDDVEKLMGTCISPMPDTKSCLYSSYEFGGGRTDCGCLDGGSFRCVRQHILEAREELIKSLGHQKFVDLGFYDMGEEVARKWTTEEERVFHQVVYSKPSSLGHIFWKHLAQVFPYRTSNEIVSYYFNVFMLRKRAAQNRSNLLDIDSDDDELPRISGSCYIQVLEEDEDSDLESPVGPYDHGVMGVNILEDDDDGDDSGGYFDGDGHVGDGSGDTTGEDSGIDYAPEALDANHSHPAVNHVDNNTESNRADDAILDDSCMSFEFQADKVDSCGPVGTKAVSHRDTSDQSKCLPGKVDGCDDDVVDRLYLLDHCDAKFWDSRYLSPIRCVDLLPTSNIIEEIFGRGNCESQTRDLNGIS